MSADAVLQAQQRVEKFLLERSRVRGLDQSEIASLNAGDDAREAVLATADLRLILAELASQQAQAKKPVARVTAALRLEWVIPAEECHGLQGVALVPAT
jgi:hypothetical protein